MQGLELSQAFFEEYGKPMLEEQFPELMPYLATGLFGSGSECFGYDDIVSQDHDYEPCFCIFLPGVEIVDRRKEFLLERAYSKLPTEYRGIPRTKILPVGGARHGVFRISDFFLKAVGAEDGKLTMEQWLSIPEEALAEATNGRIFFDHWGEVSRIRNSLMYFPEDIRLKRLAGNLLLMAQAGQYNYRRCLLHGEEEAAQMAAVEFVKSALSVVFLLNRRYQPYYKWCFRTLRELSQLSHLCNPLYSLIATGNESKMAECKEVQIEAISKEIVSTLLNQGLTNQSLNELERQAYIVNAQIKDATLRNMHILAAV